ncbi:MAG: leucine-rich repeat protein [Verrucomicrobiales bacterium]|nr:leucine-rich repeat protein [Verrucomicrobiales bacterium]
MQPSTCISSDAWPNSVAGHFSDVCALRWLLPLVLALSASAQPADYVYTAVDGKVTITGYFGNGRVATIPSTIDGLPVTAIGSLAFFHRSSLTNVTIPDSVTSIGSYAFARCTLLESITIPDNLTNIGDAAFADCTTLASIRIPSSVTMIGVGVFAASTNLAEITVDEDNPAYRSVDGVLCNKSLTTLIQCPEGKSGSYSIPDRVIRIGDRAFASATRLASVSILNGVLSIGDSAFIGCASLTSVIIPSSVTTIGETAFLACLKLVSVGISNGVASIGKAAFYDCPSLAAITIPSSVVRIGDYAFAGCTSLAAITVDAGNSNYGSVDGVLFDKSLTTLIQCPGGNTVRYTVPNKVISIGDYAFHSCVSLTSVTIPNSVKFIGNGAFHSCTSLANVYFEGTRPSLSGETVFGCSCDLTIYYLPDALSWRSTFGGRPTAVWRPQILPRDSGFGIQANPFEFTIRWARGKTVVVEASPSVVDSLWSPVGTNTLADGSSYFSDPQWASHPTRFFRLRSP